MKDMKRNALMLAIALTAATASARMPEAGDVVVKDISAARDGSRLNISFALDCSKMPSKSNIETSLRPMLKAGSDSLMLDAVTMAGRTRYLQAKRNNELDRAGMKVYRAGKTPVVDYSTSVAWQPWMENATLDLIVENLGCCHSRKTLAERPLAQLNMGDRTFDVDLAYITPVEERVKTRNARGEAYIDFKVSKTNILPDYRNNPRELAKIRATIDSVKNDADTKITSVTITGYASPEGSYTLNEKLAQGRTVSLSNYVSSLYSFPRNLMHNSWVAEDWEGLRGYVAKSEIAAKENILAIIDGPLSPDEKDRKIKMDYPTDYAYMLENWYPALRHSDYTVEYVVRSYTDPAEIARVMKTQPSKLSLREFFILAETLRPDSPEYAEVFETAAKMYPRDPVANLNAANCSLSRGDLSAAERYLAKGGDSGEAEYARGVLAAKKGDLQEAARFFKSAASKGIDISAAEKALNRMNAPEVVEFN